MIKIYNSMQWNGGGTILSKYTFLPPCALEATTNSCSNFCLDVEPKWCIVYRPCIIYLI